MADRIISAVDNCGLSDLNDENYYIENELSTDEQIAELFYDRCETYLN